MIYNNILETIGNTPVIRINKLAPEGIEMFVKVEAFNPMASVKDRLALGIILDAEKRGLLKPGQTVIEATSGNTGIALAMVCAVRGHPFVSVMAESFSVERRRLMRFLGAKVVLTPAAERATGMVRVTEALAAKHGWFMTQQFENQANPAAHYFSTGPEIYNATGGKIDAFVAGVGTGGTITGAGTYLKEKIPEILICAVEPKNSAVLSGQKKVKHSIQGIGAGFIPPIFNTGIYCRTRF